MLNLPCRQFSPAMNKHGPAPSSRMHKHKVQALALVTSPSIVILFIHLATAAGAWQKYPIIDWLTAPKVNKAALSAG